MTTYDLRSLNLPRLAGRALKLFTGALENAAIRGLLMPGLLENGGIPAFRRKQLSEAPTLYPLVEPGAQVQPEPIAFDLDDRPGFPFRSIGDYARAYRSGETTPIAVAEQALAAIAANEQSTTKLNLFIAINREDVLAQARASTQRFANGQPLSLLDGVPVAVKDEVDMLPYATTVGTRFLGEAPATQDATVVARLRAAGALLVGKANMHEIGINPNGFNDAYGTVRNPHDPTCDPGGSSSGSAAVVAAGVAPAAIGADGGGSIRIPASLCGIVGLKATFGRISEFGAAPLGWSVGHLGPLTASVTDAAMLYSIIAGPDLNDGNTLQQPAVSLHGWNTPDLDGVTAGIYPEWFEHADAEVVKINRALVDALQTRGMKVKEIVVPELDAMRVAHAITILSEMALNMKRHAGHRKEHGAPVRLNLMIGDTLTAADYIHAQQMRTRAMDHFKRIFEEVDVILTPATAKAAQPFLTGALDGGWTDLSLDTEMMRFIIPGNLVGLPAISFPSGYDSRGMPVGMQAIGRHWQEHLLLRVAYNAETVVERRLPKVFFG